MAYLLRRIQLLLEDWTFVLHSSEPPRFFSAPLSISYIHHMSLAFLAAGSIVEGIEEQHDPEGGAVRTYS